jgi:hypothetical protein
MRDVVVQKRAGDRDVIAISREPGVLGEAVVVEVPADETTEGLKARIVESQPVVVNGTVRHRLRLEAMGAGSRDAGNVVQRGSARQ